MTPIGEFSKAIKTGDIDAAKRVWHPKLLEGSTRTLEGYVVHAAEQNQIRSLEYLLELGADLNCPEMLPEPENATYRASQANALHAMKWLIEHGAAFNQTFQGVDRCLSLTTAARQGYLEMCKLLVEHGALVNFVWANISPLSIAVTYNQREVVEYLLSIGAKTPEEILGQSASRSFKDRPYETWTLAEEVITDFEIHVGEAEELSQQQIVATGIPISIHVIPPDEERPFVTLFTTGLSEHPMQVPPGQEAFARAELYIQLPADWNYREHADPNWGWPQYWLRSMAQYPTEQGTWLGGRFTLVANDEPPRPLAPNTKFTTLLLMADRNFESRDGYTIQLYRLLPLYTEERDLELRDGLPALLAALDANGVSFVVDMHRKNVGQ